MTDKEKCAFCGKTGLKGTRGKKAHESKCIKNPNAKNYYVVPPAKAKKKAKKETPVVEEPEITEEEALEFIEEGLEVSKGTIINVEDIPPEVEEQPPAPSPTTTPEPKPEEEEDPENDEWFKWLAIGLVIVGIIVAVCGVIWFWYQKNEKKKLEENAKKQQSGYRPPMIHGQEGTPA